MDAETKRIRDFKDSLFETILECWDADKLIDLYYAEYQRGYAKGRADERAAVGERLERIEGTLDFLTKNAAPAGHDKVIGQSETAGDDRESMERVPAKASSPEASAPASPKPERPKPPEGKKDMGGRVNPKRPADLEINLELAIMAIEALGGRAAAPQIREWIRKNKWSGISEHWTATLYDFVHAGKLARDGINFTLPKSKSEDVPAFLPKEPHHVLPREPARAPMPPVKPTAGPRPAPSTAVKFEHGERSTMLATSRQYVLAGKLRAAMGKGHVSESFLAQSVFGSNTDNNRQLVKSECLGMNEALADVGLSIEFYAGYGFIMKEAST